MIVCNQIMAQVDKQNQIRNSKLQMSIKPFVISREELGKSKSVDKTRKGISRVNTLKQNSVSCHQLPVVVQQMNQKSFKNTEDSNVEFNCLWRTGPQIKMNTNEVSRRNSIQYNIHKIPSTNWNSNKLLVTQNKGQDNWIKKEKHKQDKNQSFNIDDRIQSFQKQLTILEKQNTDITIQRNNIKNKFDQERARNEQMEKKLDQISSELDRKNRIISDKEELLKQKQRYINELLAISQSDKQKLAECHQHILKLSLELQSSTTKIVNLRESFCQNSHPSLSRIQELQRKLKEQKQQKYQTEQKYRQLLIKSSLIVQEKEGLQKKLSLLNYQIQDCEENERQLIEEMKRLQKLYQQCKNEALFGRACRKEMDQLQKLRTINNDLNQKIRELQKRRLNQIQFHQEDVRRAILNQKQKNQTAIQMYKQTIESLAKQLDEHGQQKQESRKEQQDQKKVIENLQNDYQELIIRLKHQINLIDERRNTMENSYKLEIQGLLSNLKQLKQDNKYLVQKLQKSEEKWRQTKQQQRTPPKQERASLQQRNYRLQDTRNQQFKRIQEEKILLKNQYDTLDVDYSKLENKFQVLQIDYERLKMKEQSFERKIKNLNEEVAEYLEDKNKMREEKMVLLQEFDKTKSELMVRQSEVRELNHVLAKRSEEKAQLENYYHQLKQKYDDLSRKKSQLEMDFSRRQAEYRNDIEIFTTQVQELKDELKLKDTEISSLKQIQKRVERQTVLQREKLLTKEYQSKNEHFIEKEKRLSALNSFVNILIEQKYLTHRSDDEEELLTSIGKNIRQLVEKIKIMELKNLQLEAKSIHAAKMEIQSKEISIKLQEKCEQLEALLIRMQEAHKQKLVLIKQDYDIVYSKYLKYRNMVITKEKESRSRQKLQKNHRR